MGKRKYIITVATLATFGIGFGFAQADNGNSLLQMNVKKSSVADTVDVTFFTTADSANSVVTRKNNNKYVVLLPNTSSNPSVTPSIGGVKDLVSNIEVKHVNDGIGGYTKVTFETTKPINIKTYMKKTNPLTQVQKDYKAILAQNNTTTKPQTITAVKQTEQKVTNTQQNKQPSTTNKQQTAQSAKQTTNNQTKQSTQTKSTTSTNTKATTTKPSITIVDVPKNKNISMQTVKPKVEQTKVEPVKPKIQKTNEAKQPQVQQDSFVPKMKYDEQGKRLIDLEPRVSHSQDENIENTQKETSLTDKQNNETQNKIQTEGENLSTEANAVETPTNKEKSNFPYWILIAGGSVLVLGILYLLFDAKKNAQDKNQARLNSFFKLSSQNQAKRHNKELYDIVNNNTLNWQEKYQTYKAKEEEQKPKKNPNEMSYVTDLSGLNKAFVPSNKDIQTPKQTPKTFEQIRQEKLQAKISKMENSLKQIHEYQENSNEVKSEDNAISRQMANIKLKSFSKMMTLNETNRENIGETSRNKSYKEGKFVKLKNSPLSVNSRTRQRDELGASDLINTGNKYLTNNGEIKMNKENEKYLLSSLDEYLSILDVEEKTSNVSANKTTIKSSTNPVMSRSGVTNPISSKNNNIPSINGFIVKSGYSIDADKGFYVVDMDGVSALIGRNGENISVLKKFDYVIDKNLQVRQDDKNVYIVKAGKYKCLVDVSQDIMKTMIEI